MSAFAYAAANHGTELLQAFIDAGADPNIQPLSYSDISITHRSQTVLGAAVEEGNTTGFESLIEHGVDPDGPHEQGLVEYLSIATIRRHLEVARVILSMLDVDEFINGAERMKFHRVFLYVANCGFTDVAERCLEKRARSDHSFWTATVGMALQSSARNRDINMSELVLNHGVDVNGLANGRVTPIYHVVHSKMVRPNYVDLVKLLFDRGSSMDKMGDTDSLFITAHMLGKVEIAKELLCQLDQSQIEANMRNTGLIQFAVTGGTRGLQLVLERGAELDQHNECHREGMWRAARSANVELLKSSLMQDLTRIQSVHIEGHTACTS